MWQPYLPQQRSNLRYSTVQNKRPWHFSPFPIICSFSSNGTQWQCCWTLQLLYFKPCYFFSSRVMYLEPEITKAPLQTFRQTLHVLLQTNCVVMLFFTSEMTASLRSFPGRILASVFESDRCICKREKPEFVKLCKIYTTRARCSLITYTKVQRLQFFSQRTF